MAVSAAGEVLGSVSGGCVEGAVLLEAQQVLAGAQPGLLHYGISDDQALGVGLTCGGEIDVALTRIEPERDGWFEAAIDALASGSPVALAVRIEGGAIGRLRVITPEDAAGSLGSEGIDHAVTADARGLLEQGRSTQRRYGPAGERRRDEVAVFVASYAPPPRMLVFGAIDYAAAMVRVGALLGYHVTVCDARAAFATPQRFPDADEVVVEWPHRYLARTPVDARTVICVLTHDPKFDVPLLEVALRTDAAYVGAMGSRRTHEDRLARLREAGVEEAALERLASPIGLDIGARTPEETAISIAAEIIQQRWGGSGRPLSETAGDIHALRAPGRPTPTFG